MSNSGTKLVLLFAVSLSYCIGLSGQSKTSKIGVEAQVYPTGFIPGVRYDLFFSDLSKMHVRLGYNIVRHGDAGEHDDERGGGFGGTLGYDILPFASHRWTFGVRTDLWFNEIDWYDDINGNRVFGTTDVTVLQPTLQAGVRLPLSEKVEVMPTLALGYEINIKTTGADVGQGAILLAGLVLNYELSAAQ